MKSTPRNPDKKVACVVAARIEEAAHRAWDAGNLKTAFIKFRAGATRGSVGCMLDLGFFHDEGLGTLRSKHEAMRWYRKAFASGDVAAATNIAILFRERGHLTRMFHWLRKGANLGDGDASVDLARCCRDGVGVSRSISPAVALARKALRSHSISPAGLDEARRLLASIR